MTWRASPFTGLKSSNTSRTYLSLKSPSRALGPLLFLVALHFMIILFICMQKDPHCVVINAIFSLDERCPSHHSFATMLSVF